MRVSLRLAALATAMLLAFGAQAQLKPSRGSGLSAPAPSAAPAPAPAPAAPKPASDAAEKEAAGKLAAAGWLSLLDRRDWGRAWETTSGVFRASVPLGTWMDGIPKVREPLGAFVDRVPANSVYKTTLEGRPDGDYVSVIFASKFAGKDLEEIVTMVREADGKWRVTGYSTR